VHTLYLSQRCPTPPFLAFRQSRGFEHIFFERQIYLDGQDKPGWAPSKLFLYKQSALITLIASSLLADPFILLILVATVRGDSKVAGTVTFEQASESSPTTITYNITGNDPNAKRGIHVHTFGDNTNGCTSAGPHCKPALQDMGLERLTAENSQPSWKDTWSSHR